MAVLTCYDTLTASGRYTTSVDLSWHVVRVRKSIMEKLLLSPAEAAEHLSIGRSKVYELMRLGQLHSVKIGGCRRIPRAALIDLVANLQDSAS